MMKSVNDKKRFIKNVIVISFDSLRSDYIAKANSKETPFFCLVRDQGASFENAISQVPFTEPSHACMLTGLYPAKTGFRAQQQQLSPHVPSIFNILKDEGFSTMASSRTSIVKYMAFGGVDQNIPFKCRKLEKAITKLDGKHFFAFLHYCDIHTPYETHFPGSKPKHLLLNALKPTHRFTDTRLLKRVLQHVRMMRVKAIRVAIKEGDTKILPAIKDGYKRSIINADKFVSGVLRSLEAAGVSDETLLVLTGDHGDSFNEHDEIHRSVEDRYEHGQFLYDNIIKVPLIFYCSAKKFTRVFKEQVRQIDIVPTILEALNVSYNGDLDGNSLWNAITGETKELAKNFAFTEVVREKWDIERRCVRTTSSKLIHDYKNDTYEIYDLIKDAEEKNNLWPGNGCSEKAILMAELEAFSRIDSRVSAPCSDREVK
jgi:arylsulfatase A-like enzyme